MLFFVDTFPPDRPSPTTPQSLRLWKEEVEAIAVRASAALHDELVNEGSILPSVQLTPTALSSHPVPVYQWNNPEHLGIKEMPADMPEAWRKEFPPATEAPKRPKGRKRKQSEIAAIPTGTTSPTAETTLTTIAVPGPTTPVPTNIVGV